MIPASYLFKDTYRQHWEEPDAPVIVEKNRRYFDGLTAPIAGSISAILARRPKVNAHFGGHAYE